MDSLKAPSLPLPLANIDTDQIIPAEYLTTTSRTGLGEHLFAGLKKQNPDFPLNKDIYRKSKILVTQHNFGCGSSREHAAWALADWGIQAILAPSFADIFYSNALKNQILPVVTPQPVIDELLRNSQPQMLTISLPDQTVTLPSGEAFTFFISPYHKNCLLKGLNDLDFLLEHLPAIQSFEARHEAELYFNLESLR